MSHFYSNFWEILKIDDHLESSGPQTRKEFFFPTEKRSIGSLFSVSRWTRSPNRPFGLIDLLLKLPKSEFGFKELKPRFPAGIALKREFGFIDRFPIGLRRPGMALKREFGFIDLVNRLPDKAPKSEFGFSTFFFPRTAKNVGLSSGLARFKAIMSWNHETYVEQSNIKILKLNQAHDTGVNWDKIGWRSIFLTSWSSSSALLRGAPARRRIGRMKHTLSIIWCVVWWEKKAILKV